MLRRITTTELPEYLSLRRAKELNVDEGVKPILDDVQRDGDEALLRLAKQLDDLGNQPIWVSSAELGAHPAEGSYKAALETASSRIRAFAQMQLPSEWERSLGEGVLVGHVVRPLERIGAYVPGGLYPLPPTLLMTVIPAQVAGVPEIIVANPRPATETLAAANFIGLDRVMRVGGAQAIAAMAFGTESVPKVDKIVGPGNAYVASAKRLLAGVVAIDSVAGPTEVAIVANEGNASWIAADLLAQAEHDLNACAILITSSIELVDRVDLELTRQLSTLSTAGVARKAICANGLAIITTSRQEQIDAINLLAPEHLCLHNPDLLPHVQNAGSVFVGPHSTEALGDYVTGPNHVLPTGGAARVKGGLSAADFVKVITYQQVEATALQSLALAATTLARVEGLEGHARSIEARL